jgi:hypothetical protein
MATQRSEDNFGFNWRSSVAQWDDDAVALKNLQFTKAELLLIEQILSDEK